MSNTGQTKRRARLGLADDSIFTIDLNSLDQEWLYQPKLYFQYASQLADTRRKLEEAKRELDVVDAESDLRIRQKQEDFGISEKVKLTEAMIKNTISLQKEHQDALHKIIVVKHKVDIVQAAVTAFDHRKSALERLVSLHGQSYFASPKPVDDSSMESIEHLENASHRDKMKKKKKEIVALLRLQKMKKKKRKDK